jgi:membrane protease YdiL (CAAX protease family)
MSRPPFHRDARFVLFGLDEGQTTWRGVGLLAVVFFGSLFIAAVLTPPAYWLVEWWHNQTGSANAQWLLGKGVDVYFDRLRMGVIVLGLPWLMSKCHLWSWQGLGLSFRKADRRGFSVGWFAGIILIIGLAVWRHTSTTAIVQGGGVSGSLAIETVVESLIAGLLLGFLEETIFRGMILRMFYTATRRPWLALALMAAFFAYTHFKVPTSVWQHVAPGVHWDTGFFVAYWTTFGISENFNLAEFVVLWLLGMVLGLLTLKSGSLLPAIGLHAGIVSAMFFYRGSGLTDGWSAAVVLAAIFLVIEFTQWKKHPTSPA